MNTPQPGFPAAPAGGVPASGLAAPNLGGPGLAASGLSASSMLASAAKPAAPAATDPGPRKLIVGPGISVSGEINSCDLLVIEGTVKADIVACKELQVAEAGYLTGTAQVSGAEIQGRFEGELNVDGRLYVRASGNISGKVRYRQLEVERGGRISGDLQSKDEEKSSEAIPLRA